MASFDKKLTLFSWLLSQFGAKDFAELKNILSDDSFLGFDEENFTLFFHTFSEHLKNKNAPVDRELLSTYDANVVRHWKSITKKRNSSGQTLYPLYFQYLAMIFTEYYLDRYFSDKDALYKELNKFLDGEFNPRLPKNETIQPFTPKDLNKLAVWIATGGGKTLIMHVNILQFEHYLRKSGRRKEINSTILLTPNEGLSNQHQKELWLSGLEGGLFQKEKDLFSSNMGRNAIIILDIYKLQEKEGEKTVSVDSFENNNLVLVDEGHRGSSGEDWLSKRNRLCEEGFSFEYSATFGQAIRAAQGSEKAPRGKNKPSKRYKLVQEYAKCIFFDYSYKHFYQDGYGKDYLILNLSEEKLEEQRQLYLTACLLAFYQQKRLFQDKKTEFAPYLIHDPLWIFVGGTVTAKNEANAKTLSDIQAILDFLARFVANKNSETVNNLFLLLANKDDLRDERNKRIFEKAFPYVKSLYSPEGANHLFQDIMETIYHGGGGTNLHFVHLKGQAGEVGLRIGDNDFFGLINVGDAAKLKKKCQEMNISNLVITEQSFSSSLFQTINHAASKINLLIGAKKFTEGWSSWRVSTMGLMNVGRSEGSEIIQLFGRGIRLKGLNFSLKRSSFVPGHKHPKHIDILETLNVFGIRSDYMKEFEEYLEAEGVKELETEVITLPVIKDIKNKNLKTLRLKAGLTPFKKARKPWLEPPTNDWKVQVVLNWYPKIQMKASSNQAANAQEELQTAFFRDFHTAFMDFDEIFFELARLKQEKAWYNIQISKRVIKELLKDPSWYVLYIPEEYLKIRDFGRVRMWQEIAVALLKKYFERYYNYKKSEYEGPNLEYGHLTEDDGNFFESYKATVEKSAQEWVDFLERLKSTLASKKFRSKMEFGSFKAFEFSRHLYKPLLHFKNNEIVRISPVPLNRGEYEFVKDLQDFYIQKPTILGKCELFLLRNLSKKGIGFFVGNNFYPDFILWVIKEGKQHVVFVDPKGLRQVQGFNDPKIKFARTIKGLERRLGDPNVHLEAFIISNTARKDVAWWSRGDGSAQAFKNNHVLFKKDDHDKYLSQLFEAVLKR